MRFSKKVKLAVKKTEKKTSANKHKYKKRSITISETTAKKLVKLNKKLEMQHDRVNDIKINKMMFIKKSTGLDPTKDNKVNILHEQKSLIDELKSVYNIDFKSDKYLMKLLSQNLCKKYLVNESCFSDCRLLHDTTLRYYYISHFKYALIQMQEQLDNIGATEHKAIKFKDNADKHVFLSIFFYYYKYLMQMVADYENRVYEYQNSLNVKLPETNQESQDELPYKELNKLLKNALNQNTQLRQYKLMLYNFDKKHNLGLSSHTKYTEIKDEEVKSITKNQYFKKILEILITKDKNQIVTKKKNLSSTIGIDLDFDNLQKKQYIHSTKKHNFFLCNDCGYNLSLKDNEQRLMKHFKGQKHLKYVEIWQELDRLHYIFKLLDINPAQYKPLEFSDDRMMRKNNSYNTKPRRSRYTEVDMSQEQIKYQQQIKVYNSRRFANRSDEEAGLHDSTNLSESISQESKKILELQKFQANNVAENPQIFNSGGRRLRPSKPSIEY
ncbi:hypothetical protein QEN19_000658 [Hanseniaspora menglaensis]